MMFTDIRDIKHNLGFSDALECLSVNSKLQLNVYLGLKENSNTLSAHYSNTSNVSKGTQ